MVRLKLALNPFKPEDVLLLLLIESLLDGPDLKANTGNYRLLQSIHPTGRLFDFLGNTAQARASALANWMSKRQSWWKAS